MKVILISTILMFFLVSTSCKKDDNDKDETVTKANIIGSVNLYDEGTLAVAKDGMVVMVEGSSPIISATTDADGKFTLTDVPFGTYTIVYEKTGYGIYKKSGVSHTNTGSSTYISATPSLGQKSTTTVTMLSANSSGSNIIISTTTAPASSNNNPKYIRYFYSTESSVSSENYTYASVGLVIKINPYDKTLSTSNLSDMGFSTGSTIYVKVYGDSFWSNEYEDNNLGRKVFPNLNSTSAAAVSFVMP